jgi:phosphoribosyl 1,2-cyclic phosphate phosphodiesterase
MTFAFETMIKVWGCLQKDTVKVICHFSYNGGMTHGQLDKFAEEYGCG